MSVRAESRWGTPGEGRRIPHLMGRWRSRRASDLHRLHLLLPHKIGRPTREDLIAGATVAIVALPLAIAFALASGAPPAAGLYSAIFGGFFAALFGGSKVNVSGPTGAMAVILVEIVREHGLTGMALAGLLAGFVQIAAGYLGAGRVVRMLPHSVIAGLTAGIAVIIFRGQVAPFLEAPVVGLVTLAVALPALRLGPKFPWALAGLMAGVGVNLIIGGPTVTGVPQGLPSPALSVPTWEMLLSVTGPALVVALLGSIEALLSAAVADGMIGARHDPDKELVGQGVGNVVTALVGGLPITGAFARTATAVRSGARSPWAAMIHSVILLAVVLALAPLARYIPVASLSAILMVVCVRMVEWEALRWLPRAPLHYSAVLLVTLALTIAADLTLAVVVGFTLATYLFVLDLARRPLKQGDAPLPSEALEHATVHVLNGPLFFGVATALQEYLLKSDRHLVILDMHRVSVIDATGARALEEMGQLLRSRGGQLILWRLDPELEDPLARLSLHGEPSYVVARTIQAVEAILQAHLAAASLPRRALPAAGLATSQAGLG